MKAIESQYPRIKINVEKELQFYKDVRPLLLPLIADTIDYTNDAFDGGRKILVEGTYVTSWRRPPRTAASAAIHKYPSDRPR